MEGRRDGGTERQRDGGSLQFIRCLSISLSFTTWKVNQLAIVNWLLVIVIPGRNALFPAFQ